MCIFCKQDCVENYEEVKDLCNDCKEVLQDGLSQCDHCKLIYLSVSMESKGLCQHCV